jgi:hypothetical protein
VLALNPDPPDLCCLGSWGYRNKPLALFFPGLLTTEVPLENTGFPKFSFLLSLSWIWDLVLGSLIFAEGLWFQRKLMLHIALGQGIDSKRGKDSLTHAGKGAGTRSLPPIRDTGSILGQFGTSLLGLGHLRGTRAPKGVSMSRSLGLV